MLGFISADVGAGDSWYVVKNLLFHKRFQGNNPSLINWITHIYRKFELKVFFFLKVWAERSVHNINHWYIMQKKGFVNFTLFLPPRHTIRFGNGEGKVIFIWFILKLLDVFPDLLKEVHPVPSHTLSVYFRQDKMFITVMLQNLQYVIEVIKLRNSDRISCHKTINATSTFFFKRSV